MSDIGKKIVKRIAKMTSDLSDSECSNPYFVTTYDLDENGNLVRNRRPVPANQVREVLAQHKGK